MIILLLQKLRENMDLDVRVLGLASSTRMLLSDSGIALDSWRDDFARCAATCTFLILAI